MDEETQPFVVDEAQPCEINIHSTGEEIDIHFLWLSCRLSRACRLRERIGSPNSEEQSDDIEIDRELENLSAQLEGTRGLGRILKERKRDVEVRW